MVGAAGSSVIVHGIPETSLWQNKRIFFICLGVSFATFQYGLDTALINGFQATQGFLRVFGTYNSTTRKWAIETTFQQLITSLLQVGLIIASLGLGYFSKFFGRRAGFFTASILSFASITIQELVTAQWPLYIARLMLGTANGMYVNLVVLYISETTPYYLRSPIVSCFQPMVSLGGLVGAGINSAFKSNLTKLSYQMQLVILYVVPVWFVFYSLYMPESPRWLITQGREEQAEASLKKLRGHSVKPEFVQLELQAIKQAVSLERETKGSATFMDIWKGTDRRRTLLCCGCAILHASSGLNLLVGYATFFFQVAGTSGDPFTNSMILKAVGVIGAIISPFLARYFGRKSLLIAGYTCTSICLLIVGLLVTIVPGQQAAGKALLAFICIYDLGYVTTIGPLAWVCAGEIPSNRLRSITFGFSMAVGFVFAWLTVFTSPFFINPSESAFIGAKVAWIWLPSNVITLIWLILYLPETQGRTLEDLDILFTQHVSARDFGRYKIQNLVEPSEKQELEEKEEISHHEVSGLPKV